MDEAEEFEFRHRMETEQAASPEPAKVDAGAGAPDEPEDSLFSKAAKTLDDATFGIGGAISEAVANLATGVVAKPVSDLLGLSAINQVGFKDRVQRRMTYEPRSSGGKLIAGYNPIALLGKGVGAVAKGSGNIVRGQETNDPVSIARGVAGNALEEGLMQAVGFAGVKGGPAISKAVGMERVPGIGVHVPGNALKRVLRGPDTNIQTMLDNARDFEMSGTTASVGQATGQRSAQAAESVLAKMPGGAGPMAAKAETQASEIGAQAEAIADRISANASPTSAGRAIERGLTGEGGFIQRFREGQKALYDRLDLFIPGNARLPMTNTATTLNRLAEVNPGALDTSAGFVPGRISQIRDNFNADMQRSAQTTTNMRRAAPGLPYEAVKRLRSQVGALLESSELVTGAPRSQLKQLYGALTQDMRQGAIMSGNPGALRAWTRADKFTRAGHERLEGVIEKLVKADTVEDMFKNATNLEDMKLGAAKISTVMKSLQPAERSVVQSAFIRRLGPAFLTNWNKMSPQAKATMFPQEYRACLDYIARSAEKIKSGSKVFANPSGTAPATAQIGFVGAVGGALATGSLKTAAVLLSGFGAGKWSANLMTNPAFVKWLATSMKKPPGTIPAAIGNLAQVMAHQPDDVKQDAADYLKSIGQPQP